MKTEKVVGLLSAVGLLWAGGGAAIFWGIESQLRSSEGARLGKETLAECGLCADELGTPLHVSRWMFGRVGGGRESLSVSVSGSKGTGEMRVFARKQGAEWVLTAATLEVPGHPTINMLESAANVAQREAYRGWELKRDGQLHASVETLDRAVETDPQNADARVQRGEALYYSGEKEKALADFQRAVELKPGDEHSWDFLTVVNLELGRNDAAIDAANHLLALDPGYEQGRAAYLRAVAEKNLGRRDDAARDVTTACNRGYRTACPIAGDIAADAAPKR